MTDRELLELAAKAAGIEHHTTPFDDGHGLWIGADMEVGEPGYWWNPLTDDGDAFRLAVKLEMDVLVTNTEAWAMADADTGCGTSITIGSDPYAATRRAIVIAAAAIAHPMNADAALQNGAEANGSDGPKPTQEQTP